MKYTDAHRQKQRDRAKAANQARTQREHTIIEWDQIIARLKKMLDDIEEHERHPHISDNNKGLL